MGYFRLLGLEKEPFSTSPDPAFFYESEQHRAVLAGLLIELRLKRGLSVVLGDIGTGKTTISRKLAQLLKERKGFFFRMLLDPGYRGERSFLDCLVDNFEICLTHPRPTILDFKRAIQKFLFEKGVEKNETVVLLIDEAQKLNKTSLECLRVLLNYETNEFKLLQLILLGQMELYPKLINLPNFLDRISYNIHLRPFDRETVKEMVDFRLRQAGHTGDTSLFSDAAIDEVYQYTGGYPRRISMLCHKALKKLAISSNSGYNNFVVDDYMIREIIEQSESFSDFSTAHPEDPDLERSEGEGGKHLIRPFSLT
jgi:general secretion pathway protein A